MAFNKAAKLSTKKYLVLGHDDMYFCPNWDYYFNEELKKTFDLDFFLSKSFRSKLFLIKSF